MISDPNTQTNTDKTMNTTAQETALSTHQQARPTREIRVVEDNGPLSYLFDTARFEHMFRISSAMAGASLIPEHLRGVRRQGSFTPFTTEQVKSNCFLVVNQSLRWGMDPFAVAPETYVVGGKLAYQGKLIAAVVNAKAPISNRLQYSFAGKKGSDDFTISVSATFKGETAPSVICLSVGEAKTQNDMWRRDPEQKLVYSGVVKWARRFCPEIVLGIMTDDDLDRIEQDKPTVTSDAKKLIHKPDFSEKTTVTTAPTITVVEDPKDYPSLPEDPAPEAEATQEPDQPTEAEGSQEPEQNQPMSSVELLEISITDAGIRPSVCVDVLRGMLGKGAIPLATKTIRQLSDGVAARAMKDIDTLILECEKR